MLKDFISKQTAFNKSVEEKLGKIDVLASKFDSLALDVELLKLKVLPNDVKESKTLNAIQVKIDDNVRMLAELHARWEIEDEMARNMKVCTITTTSDVISNASKPPTLIGVEKRDFYFRALGSLVVLSFPQPLSFSSVLPKPLSKTLTRSSDGRNPIKLTVGWCWQVGPLLVPRSGHASTYPDHRGTHNLSTLACRIHSLPRCLLQNGSLSQPRARACAIASPFFPRAPLFFFSASGSPSPAGG
jgi:hypothetical protein